MLGINIAGTNPAEKYPGTPLERAMYAEKNTATVIILPQTGCPW
jgi:hypothetical protein